MPCRQHACRRHLRLRVVAYATVAASYCLLHITITMSLIVAGICKAVLAYSMVASGYWGIVNTYLIKRSFPAVVMLKIRYSCRSHDTCHAKHNNRRGLLTKE